MTLSRSIFGMILVVKILKMKKHLKFVSKIHKKELHFLQELTKMFQVFNAPLK